MGQLQITQEGYEEIKSTIKAKLNETTNNFIIIGYYLKQVNDNMLYTRDGYRNIEEFAQGEYHLSLSTANRFMDINTRFSEGGNSLEIKEEYRNFGYSKLQEMLNVKEEDMQLITEDMTVKQIREIKAAEREEDRIEKEREAMDRPLIKMFQSQQEETETVATSQDEEEYSPIEKTLLALWEAKPAELLAKVHNHMITPQELAEELCPSGSRTFNHGVYMLFLYDGNMGLKFRYYANGKPNVETYSYDDIIRITNEIITDSMFQDLMTKKKQPEEKKDHVQEAKPEKHVEQKTVEEKKPVKTQEVKKEEPYTPLPGQTKLEDIPELQEDEEKEKPVTVEQGAIDAEYRELEQEKEHENQEDISPYTEVEIRNAISYFEVEYYRMVGTGLKESPKCRNYKMAMEAIKQLYEKEKNGSIE